MHKAGKDLKGTYGEQSVYQFHNKTNYVQMKGTWACSKLFSNNSLQRSYAVHAMHIWEKWKAEPEDNRKNNCGK